MKGVSLRNLSLLGLVLMGASAVTAAIMPKNTAKAGKTGEIALISLDGNGPRTCREIDQNGDCDLTITDNINSFSTQGGVTSVDALTTGATNTGTNPGVNGTLVSSVH